MTSEILPLLLPLQLPCEVGCEFAQVAAIVAVLDSEGVPPEDRVDYLRDLVDSWSESGGAPGGLLLSCVQAAVSAGMPSTGGTRLAHRYERLHRGLAEENLDLFAVLGVISQSPIAYRLASLDQMSATVVQHH